MHSPATAVIVSAVRTPIGRFGGALAPLPAAHLGQTVIAEAVRRAGIVAGEVDEVIFGQVLTAGAGQNPARQAALSAGLPVGSTAFTLNQVCGSGLRAVALAAQAVRLGEAGIVVAGGQESMSQAPHCVPLRAGVKFGDVSLIDTALKDGLLDAFHGYPMGRTAENLAERWKIDRATQDAFALDSQRKAAAADAAGRFREEIVPVRIPGRKGEMVERDEAIRAETSAGELAALRPAFGDDGTVTAGNASGLNDGAAALVVMAGAEVARRGLAPLGRIAAWATAGVEPALMGTGPIPAVRLALERAGWKLGDVDLIEANEAFAVQACVVGRELRWDPARVNVNGGAIALGHPIGASGARVLVTLLHEMARRGARRGLATLCIGGGMGIALCVERD